MIQSINESIAEKELLELAKKKFKKRKDFYIHLFIYGIGIVVFVLKTYCGVRLNFFPLKYINCLVMSIWTVVIGFQAIELLFSEVIFGKKWEDKQVKNIIEDKSKKQTWE